ncbi:MAG: protein-glutamate O-methyltransferase CheR [Candidatus Geothermincolales bacterium]
MITGYELGEREFRKISSMAYQIARLNLHQGKKLLVQNRLSKRLRALGIPSFREYLEYLEANPDEVRIMVDCLTTNFTRLFREPEHFEFLREVVIPWLESLPEERIRLWSAGCSSGEEPYSIAIFLREHMRDLDARDLLILATDISVKALTRAREGVYREDQLRDCPAQWRLKYFTRFKSGGENYFRVSPAISRLVRFHYLNLADPWPMKGPFQVIFCRNVMIYFDRDTQEELVHRFHDYLAPGGYFFVGHSESLARIKNPFRYRKPSIYQKVAYSAAREESDESSVTPGT